MDTDFEKIATALRAWLLRHNLPTEGVTIGVTLPMRRHVFAAEAALRRETELHAGSQPLPAGIVARINGIDVRFWT